MTLNRMLLKRLTRQRAKSLFILLGLAVGVGAGVGVLTLTGALSSHIEHKLELYGANILIAPAVDEFSFSFGGITVGAVSLEIKELHEADLKAILSIPNARNIAAVGPSLLGNIEHSGQRLVIAGMDFTTLGVLRPWWRIMGRYPEGAEVVLGSELARLMDLKIGDVISPTTLGWRVSGILETTGSQEDFIVFAPLKEVQRALGKDGKVSMAEVAALCSGCPIEEIVAQISKVLPQARVRAIKNVVEGRLQAVRNMRTMGMGLSGIVLLIGGLVVFVTMTASVRDRTPEIGILRAVGFSEGHIIKAILMEAGVLSLVAGLLGWGMGLVMAKTALPFFSEGHEHWAQRIGLDPEVLGISVALAVGIGIVSSVYPALAASRMDPVEAIRSQ